MGCNRLGIDEDKIAVQEAEKVASLRSEAPDCSAREVEKAFARGGEPAVRALQASKENVRIEQREQDKAHADDNRQRDARAQDAQIQRDRDAQVQRDREAQVQRDREAQIQRDRDAQVQRDRDAQVQRDREAQVQRDREAQVQRDREAQVQRDREAQVQRDREAQVQRDLGLVADRAAQEARRVEEGKENLAHRDRLTPIIGRDEPDWAWEERRPIDVTPANRPYDLPRSEENIRVDEAIRADTTESRHQDLPLEEDWTWNLTEGTQEFFREMIPLFSESFSGAEFQPMPERFPGVTLHSAGFAFGKYDELKAFLRETTDTGRPNQDHMVFESHHLLEDQFMGKFGISKTDGLCVALEWDEHRGWGSDSISSEIRAVQGETLKTADIEVVYKAHCEFYQDNPVFIAKITEFLIEKTSTIKASYEEPFPQLGNLKDPDFDERKASAFRFLDSLAEGDAS